MKSLKLLFALAVLSLAPMGSAWADGHGHGSWGGDHDHHGWGGHSHIGIGIGIGPWAPWYYPPPIYYPPAYYYPRTVVIEQPAPPVYVEQADEAPAQTNYWYYCSRSKAYYPYVKDCPAGWQRVVPQPPPQ
ncbi:MAG: hypothetical protein WAX67_00840 [Rugosibacter sp.]